MGLNGHKSEKQLFIELLRKMANTGNLVISRLTNFGITAVYTVKVWLDFHDRFHDTSNLCRSAI